MEHHNELTEAISHWESAAQKLPWFKTWHTPLIWNLPYAHWFAGGELNASYICLDIHIERGRGEHVAIAWESENGQTATLTYAQLYKQVNQCAQFLKTLGVQKGDRVVVYMPMIPETVVTLLALARLGATHVVVFSGFSSQALRDRIDDVGAAFVITADHMVRRGKKIDLKAIVDTALAGYAGIQHVVVFDRTGNGACITNAVDVVYSSNVTDNKTPHHSPACPEPAEGPVLSSVEGPVRHSFACPELVEVACPEFNRRIEGYVEPVAVPSNHPLFILYTSGTTGKPKGIVHGTGGYLTHCYETFARAFAPQADDVYWCTADFGWITGHSYVVYAPLMHGLTLFLYEGAPDFPDAGIWWSLIEKYKISILYTSPTALRMAMKAGNSWPAKYDLRTLKKLGSVGEPLNPEVWTWYHTVIGASRCPIVDTWWQTETGGFMIFPYFAPSIKLRTSHFGKLRTSKASYGPSYEALAKYDKPGSAGKPVAGVTACVVDEDGVECAPGQKGYLIIRHPWPGMMLGVYNDPERFMQTYFLKFNNAYFTGDYAVKDADGDFWLLGRADEVLNIAGHRIGTAEIESALLNHPMIAESAAIGIADTIVGERVVAFVMLKNGTDSANFVATSAAHETLVCAIKATVRNSIGAFVVPSAVYIVKQLPKTRSGKIMRRLLKGVLEGKALGDMSTLEDQASIDDVTLLYERLQKEVRK